MSILESCPACGSSDVAVMSQQNRALSQTVGELLAEAERLRDGRAETVAARRDLDEARAEVARLRAVVDAARRLRGGDFWGAEWWVLDLGDYGVGCAYCDHGKAARCQDVRHADDCPAIALDRALDALSR